MNWRSYLCLSWSLPWFGGWMPVSGRLRSSSCCWQHLVLQYNGRLPCSNHPHNFIILSTLLLQSSLSLSQLSRVNWEKAFWILKSWSRAYELVFRRRSSRWSDIFFTKDARVAVGSLYSESVILFWGSAAPSQMLRTASTKLLLHKRRQSRVEEGLSDEALTEVPRWGTKSIAPTPSSTP